MNRFFVVLLALLANIGAAHAAWGDRDCSYGNTGIATLPQDSSLGAVTNSPLSMVLEGDGNVVVRKGYEHGYTRLSRLSPGGALLAISDQPHFASGLRDVTDASLPSGGLLLAGRWDSVAPGDVKRLLPNGQLDTTFGSGGFASATGFHGGYGGPIVQGDGKILVPGSTSTGEAIARFNEDGSPDATFGVGGVAGLASSSPYHSIALQSDGKIVALGPLVLSRYLANGQIDTTFGAGGTTTLPGQGMQVRVQSSGKIVVLYLAVPVDRSETHIARYSPTGTLEISRPVQVPGLPSGQNTFGEDFTARSLDLMPDDRPVVKGAIINASHTVVQGAVVRMNPDLSDDVGRLLDFQPTVIRVLPDGKLLLGAGDYFFAQVRRLLGDNHPSTCAATTTTMSPTAPNPSVHRQLVTYTATVTSGGGTPTGAVLFKRDGVGLTSAPLVNGAATSTYEFTPAGSHGITATYVPSGGPFSESSSAPPVTQVVFPSATINDPTANSATTSPSMTFTVTLGGGAFPSPVSVDYATADQTAQAGIDYTASSGTLTFAPGETSKTIVVPIVAQSVPSPSKAFFLGLSNPVNAGLARSAGVGTIVYAASGALSLYVADASVAEGYSGTTLLGFTVSLSQPNPSAVVTVDYATSNGTASAGTDYTAQSGTLTFHPGYTQQWVIVPLAANAAPQPNRTLFVDLSNASAGVIAKGQATGTIVDDDPAPAATQVPMYRLYSHATKEHLYTTDANEYAVLPGRGWVPEGVAFNMFTAPGSYGGQYGIPLYRLYFPGILQHHWTTDWHEAMVLVTTRGWEYEGIPGYLLPATVPGSTPLYRLSYHTPSLHIWTTDLNERNVLSTQYGWADEGIVGEVLP